jgi:hypothetical protein
MNTFSAGESLDMTTLRVMYVAMGLLLSALAIPLIMRKIGPNPIYGFRVKQTLEDPKIWYEVNAVAGKGLFVDGLIVVIASVILAAVPGISVDRYALSVTALFFVALGITLAVSVRELRRCVRAGTPEIEQGTSRTEA